MDKINFKNLPSTETPINANNLNLLQDNVENSINKENTNYDIIAKNAGTYSIDINKYKFLFLFNCYLGELNANTNILGGKLCPISLVKIGSLIKSSFADANDNIHYNTEVQYNSTTGSLTVGGTTINNMYPCVYGIY